MSHVLHPVTLQLPATLNSLTTLGHALRDFLTPLHLSEGWIYPLDLALCEAASNVIRHAYRDDAGKSYRVSFAGDAQGITVTLCDSGLPVPEEKLQPGAPIGEGWPDAMSEGGRGWPLIFASVDSVHYQRGAEENQLTLWRALPPEH